MTTDTAVRVTRMVVQDKSQRWMRRRLSFQLTDCLQTVPVEKIPYIDNPELKLDEHESTEMPFRYVKGADGQPIMPEVTCNMDL